jgi:hypothetical protein
MPTSRKVVMPKGQRYPGSGRRLGTPNKVSVEARVLVGQLVTDAEYQRKLRRDFVLRKLHPTIESMVWAYHIGRPKESITLDATVDVTGRLEHERAAFALLDVAELELLAAESQGLVDRAMTLAKARLGPAHPQDIVVEAERVEDPAESLGNTSGSDNTRYVNHSELPNEEPEPPNIPHETEGNEG